MVGGVGTGEGIRTPDPRLRRPMLCPTELRLHGGREIKDLLYATRKEWWAHLDLNQEPTDYEPVALTVGAMGPL